MRQTTAWVVVVGIAMLGTGSVAKAADDGFWVSIASGVAGVSTPSNYQEFWFETPHGPSPVAITQLSGTSALATTAGGSSFFNRDALPVVLNPTDGYASITGGNPPSDLSQALKRQMAGGKGMASTSPDPFSATAPSNANLLSINATTSDTTGVTTLGVSMTDPQSNSLGSATVTVPDGGWWVLGLGPNPNDTTTPPPTDSNPPPDSGPPPTSGDGGDNGGGGPMTTPEPATILLAGLGGLGAFGWQRYKRRREW